MKIAIIGAGLTGLVTAKVLAAKGHSVTIFEQRSSFGGVWEASRRYAGLRIQSPRELYVFSDFDMPADYPEFPSGLQIARYLEAYIAKFGLDRLIRFNTRVTALRRNASQSGWRVDVSDSAGAALAPEQFDHVVVCNGRNSIPATVEVPGRREFEAAGGRIMHSVEFHDPELAKDKRVAVVGFGKSALDVAYEARVRARRVTVVCRRTAWHIPHTLFGFVPAKRLSYSRSAEFWFGRKKQGVEGFVHRRLPWLVRLYWAVSDFIIGTHMGLRGRMRPPYSLRESIGISMGFGFTDNLRALRSGQIGLAKGALAKLAPGTLTLDTGENVPADLVILATGFAQDLAIFSPEDLAKITTPAGDYRLYRHAVPPGLPDLTFNGYNATTAVPLTSEVSAHWIAGWLDGSIAHPDASAIERVVEEELAWRRAGFRADNQFGHFVAPLSFFYLDTLLADMGLPPADSYRSPLVRNNAMLNPKDYAFLNRKP